MPNTLALKFNGGRGALLCWCDKILAEGWDHYEKEYVCKCGGLFRIGKRCHDEGKTVYEYTAE